jgi:hypothetical protein
VTRVGYREVRLVLLIDYLLERYPHFSYIDSLLNTSANSLTEYSNYENIVPKQDKQDVRSFFINYLIYDRTALSC